MMATAGGDDHTRPGRGADFLSDASRLSALKLARSVWTSEVEMHLSMEYLDQHRRVGERPLTRRRRASPAGAFTARDARQPSEGAHGGNRVSPVKRARLGRAKRHPRQRFVIGVLRSRPKAFCRRRTPGGA